MLPWRQYSKSQYTFLYRLRVALRWLHDHGHIQDRALVRVQPHPKGAVICRADMPRKSFTVQRANGQMVEIIGNRIIPR